MSGFGKLNWLDIGKGFLIAVGTVILMGVGNILQTGRFPNGAELLTIAGAGLSAGITYLLKNVFTNSENKLVTKEPDKL